MTRILAIVPARGGSKSIPEKNIALCCGVPLIKWTLDAIRDSVLVDDYFISTDSQRIATVCNRLGYQVPALRPSSLSQDSTSPIDVVLHSLDVYSQLKGKVPNTIVLLQPTSPLRCSTHIDEAIKIFLDSSHADSLVSVVQTDHASIPECVMRMQDDYLRPYDVTSSLNRRQDKPVYYSRNGAAIYIAPTKELVTSRSFIGRRCLPFVMSRYSSIDVDTPLDLRIAEFFLMNPQLSQL
jgi:CMP-N,N'-diacetyllegionaminic acid synthase